MTTHNLLKKTLRSSPCSKLLPEERPTRLPLDPIARKRMDAEPTDKWQRQVDDATDFLVNTRWKGQNSYPLASFVATMREKWMDIEAASKHVPVQIPLST